MSRRPNDLDPGTDPGARGPVPNGRPPSPPGGSRPSGGSGNDRQQGSPPGEKKSGGSPSLRWVPWIVLALIAAAFLVSSLASGSSSKADLTYSQFVQAVDDGQRQEHRVQQVDRRDQRRLHRSRKRARRSSRAQARRTTSRRRPESAQGEERRRQVRRHRQQPLRRHPAVGAAARADRRPVRLAQPSRRTGPDGRGDEHRAQPGEGLQHREAEDDVRRRRRLRPGEAGDRRGRRLPEEPREVQGHRRAHPEGCAARRPSRHRQDAHRTRGRGRSGRAVRVGHRFRLHGDVRRCRRSPRARPVPDRTQAGARDHLRRRDRLHRPQARRGPRRRSRRARADAQPDARGDGRLRGHRGHRDDGRHQPARRARPRVAPSGSLRPPDPRAVPHAGRAGADPEGALPRQEDLPRTSTSTSSRAARPACRAPTSPTS